jgi:site-specific DNA recombinase
MKNIIQNIKSAQTQFNAMYCRVSSEKQAKAQTIESQINSLKEFANENAIVCEEDLKFIDNGISGSTMERPGLDSLRDRVRQGDIQKILILSPDRLARKYAHQLILVEEFQRLGAEIIFANRNITQSPEDQLLFQMQGVIAEFEREKILERNRRGKLYKAKKGDISVLSSAPYGFIYRSAQNGSPAKYEIHENESAVVEKIYKLYTEEMYSLNKIAKLLTIEGIPTKHNTGHWDKSVVWGVLLNPAYMGKAAYRKTEAAPRQRPTKLARDNSLYPKTLNSSVRSRAKEDWIFLNVPKIIEEAVYNRAQLRLEQNKIHSIRNRKHEYLLTGLMRCKECGYSLYGKAASRPKHKRLLYYRCIGQDANRRPSGRVCKSTPIRVEVLEDIVWEKTSSLLNNPDLALKEYQDRISANKNKRDSSNGFFAAKQKEIRQLENEKEKLLDLYQSGIISKEELTERISNVRKKINNTQEELKLFENEQKEKENTLKLIENFEIFKNKLNYNLQNLVYEDKKKVIQLLVKEIIVDVKKQEVDIRHIVPLAESCRLRDRSLNPALMGSNDFCRSRINSK